MLVVFFMNTSSPLFFEFKLKEKGVWSWVRSESISIGEVKSIDLS